MPGAVRRSRRAAAALGHGAKPGARAVQAGLWRGRLRDPRRPSLAGPLPAGRLEARSAGHREPGAPAAGAWRHAGLGAKRDADRRAGVRGVGPGGGIARAGDGPAGRARQGAVRPRWSFSLIPAS
ncbi:hypothetical protein G6F57_021102 [Rhizopus arrhizus]|nr:hypothetical protein G6F57_021102 [Rhizopus arrhizus]